MMHIFIHVRMNPFRWEHSWRRRSVKEGLGVTTVQIPKEHSQSKMCRERKSILLPKLIYFGRKKVSPSQSLTHCLLLSVGVVVEGCLLYLCLHFWIRKHNNRWYLHTSLQRKRSCTFSASSMKFNGCYTFFITHPTPPTPQLLYLHLILRGILPHHMLSTERPPFACFMLSTIPLRP